jgi:hypothetical protein
VIYKSQFISPKKTLQKETAENAKKTEKKGKKILSKEGFDDEDVKVHFFFLFC